ncbi:hypothetical protein LZP81_30740 [Streptomyces parvulus]|uniref:hypothetical protein n=1 Tax=Streptomyces parvulus TaxID=146923 RepID=UPI001E50C576|nr:hypothetical protein [Streptomyces parvulus]MCC9154917.1 hypothetical protein [Streptomyces parvulus]MCE7691238.1 hypothetical protein [Streptomyces parvulus]
MPSSWSPPPTTLPDPQEIQINLVKFWSEDTEDGAGVAGRLQIMGGGRPTKDALDALMATLLADGWQVNVAQVTQTITRTFIPEPVPDPEPQEPETPPEDGEPAPE